MMRIGVLAVQGAFAEHERVLRALGADCVELRQKKDIAGIDGLVLPGGESTVQGLLLRQLDMFDELKGLLTDIGTEELGHLEMIGAIVHQLTRNLKDSQLQDSAFAPYLVDQTAGVSPTSASGSPWNAASMAVKGDPMADLTEDLAADGTTVQEQRG